jgi:ADP-heptose:LPS heptosyltransferase
MTNFNLARKVDFWVGLVLCLLVFGWERTVGRLRGRRLPSLLATTPPPEGAPPIVPRRILAIKFYGLGNAVMLVPVLAAVREAYPDVEIDFLTLPGNVSLLERSGVVTRVLTVETSTLGRFAQTLWATFQVIRARRYDVLLDFEQFIKLSTLIGWASGAQQRIGFNTDGQRRGFVYTTRVVYTDSDHMSAIYARLLRPLGITGPLPDTLLRTTAADRTAVRELLAKHGVPPDAFPLIAVHAGIGDNFYHIPLKRWDPAHFATVAEGLAARWGATIVFTGRGEEERQVIAQIRARMTRPSIDACDALSVPQLAALLERCDLVVANDTSVMHLAGLVDTPVVAIFGPTAPLHYGPRGSRNLVFYRDLYCSPCLTNYNLKVSRCREPVCMRGIEPDAVLHAVGATYLDENAVHRDWLRGRARAASAA